jgi:hypothetical protein
VQGVIDYFDARDTTTPNIDPPPPVADVRATSSGAGSVTLTWTPGTASSWAGGAATGYTIYASTNGRGFDGGTQVAGGATSSFTLTGLDPHQQYYFKVVTRNTGGESPGSEVVAALPNGAAKRVLIVNGFDRNDRSLVPKEPFAGGSSLADRVRPRLTNSFDYAVQMAEAIRLGAAQAALVAPAINTASNESVASGAISLAAYDAVFWILGEESTANDTFDAAEQSRVTTYLNGGGKLFVSGAEIGWDLDSQGGGQAFYNNTLRADYVSDDANSYTAIGAAGSIFAGVNLSFDNGTQFYNVDFPDTITPLGGSLAAMIYVGGSGGTAGVQYASGDQRLVMLAFPFETVLDPVDRTDVMARTLEFFGILTPPPFGDLNDDGDVNAADYTVWRDSLGSTVAPGDEGDADFDGAVTANDYDVWVATYGQLAMSLAFAESDAPALAAASLGETAGEDPAAVLASVSFGGQRRGREAVGQPCVGSATTRCFAPPAESASVDEARVGGVEIRSTRGESLADSGTSLASWLRSRFAGMRGPWAR